MVLLIPEMAKQVIFWCAVFVVVAISAELVGEMWSAREAPQQPAQPVPLVVTTATAIDQSAASEQSN